MTIDRTLIFLSFAQSICFFLWGLREIVNLKTKVAVLAATLEKNHNHK